MARGVALGHFAVIPNGREGRDRPRAFERVSGGGRSGSASCTAPAGQCARSSHPVGSAGAVCAELSPRWKAGQCARSSHPRAVCTELSPGWGERRRYGLASAGAVCAELSPRWVRGGSVHGALTPLEGRAVCAELSPEDGRCCFSRAACAEPLPGCTHRVRARGRGVFEAVQP